MMNEEANNFSVQENDLLDEASKEQTYSISELAKEFGLTTRAIRFYEDEKLISPLRAGRQRIYSPRDYTRLKLILRGKRLGFSLTDIRGMFDLYDSEPGEAAQLKLALDKAAKRKILLEQQLEDIQLTMDELTKFENQCKACLHEMET